MDFFFFSVIIELIAKLDKGVNITTNVLLISYETMDYKQEDIIETIKD